MTDKRFNRLILAASVTVIAVAFIWKYPDIAKANVSRDAKLSEYVYVDDVDIIHIDRKCSRLNYKGLQSERIKREKLSTYEFKLSSYSFCPKCVSDKDYEVLNNYK